MTDMIEVRTATASQEAAHTIAHALVAQRLAASAQVSGPISSLYWWKDAMISSEEWVVTAKTQHHCYQDVEHAIRRLHPYEEPGILAFPITDGSATYFQWIVKETTEQAPQTDGAHVEAAKEQLLCAFDAAYEKLVSAASHAAERGMHLQDGAWGPREVLAHIAGWAAQATAQLPQVIGGIPPINYASEVQHAGLDEAANVAFIALIGNQTFEEVLAIAHQTHRRFVDMLRGQDDAIFVPGKYVYERMQRVIAHHLEHAQELEGSEVHSAEADQ